MLSPTCSLLHICQHYLGALEVEMQTWGASLPRATQHRYLRVQGAWKRNFLRVLHQ